MPKTAMSQSAASIVVMTKTPPENGNPSGKSSNDQRMRLRNRWIRAATEENLSADHEGSFGGTFSSAIRDQVHPVTCTQRF
jgi:hypothetical protein